MKIIQNMSANQTFIEGMSVEGRTVGVINSNVTKTGFHTLMSGYELAEGFWGSDCEPLDAPNYIATGGSRSSVGTSAWYVNSCSMR